MPLFDLCGNSEAHLGSDNLKNFIINEVAD